MPAELPLDKLPDKVQENKVQDQRNLDTKFAGGLAWTAGVKWATQVLTWGSLIVIGHLLSPADVGIGAIAGMFVGITNVLAEFGIGTAVLHMPELNRKALGQLHLFSMLLCTGIFVISALLAPVFARVFNSNHVLFFAANGLAFLLTGLQAVPFGLLQRDMDYRRLAFLEALMSVVGSVVTIAAAFGGLGFWALLLGPFAGKLSSTAQIG